MCAIENSRTWGKGQNVGEETDIIKYKDCLVNSKEKTCVFLQVGKAEMTFQNW